MATKQLLEINTFALLISILIPVVLSYFLAAKTLGNIEKMHLVIIFVVGFFSGILLKIPIFLSLGIALFGCVVYSFRVSKY